MRIAKSVAGAAMIGLLVAACGGTGTATQGPGGGGGTPTQNPDGGGTPTLNPGGGGGGGNTGGGTGMIHVEVGGPISVTKDYPFFSVGSRFGGQAGVALNFTTDGGDGIASVTSTGTTTSDTWTISLITPEVNANSADCQLTGWTIAATSASGTFDCKNGFAIKVADGSYLTGVTMKGNFTASQ